MFEYLIGYVTDVGQRTIVLEVNGIGYKIWVPNPQVFQAGSKQRIRVYVHQVVSDVSEVLYGFKHRIDKVIFERLINVSGIGPKNAVAILSGNDPQTLLNAIHEENVTYLTKFPGVGKKTAKQIILDLHGKLGHLMTGGASRPKSQPVRESSLTDALAALRALGYRKQAVSAVKDQLARQPKLTVNQYLSRGLKLLNRLG